MRGGKIAYQAINNLRTSERPRQWTMDDLANGRTDSQLLEDLADYYEQITEDFEPAVKGSILKSYYVPKIQVTASEVESAR